jgi:hypothetical protein
MHKRLYWNFIWMNLSLWIRVRHLTFFHCGKENEFRYPKVAAMARDILSIFIFTVASESTFSIGRRVIDQYKSSLKPNIVEALVCTRDWLYGE